VKLHTHNLLQTGVAFKNEAKLPRKRAAPQRVAEMLCYVEFTGGVVIMEAPKLTLRAEFSNGCALGPGKIRLLEAIDHAGSISQAGRNLGMSYRRAWVLVDEMNNCFRQPVVEAQPGGTRGGGATLTPLGKELIERYRAMEAAAMQVSWTHLHKIEASLNRSKAPRPPNSIKRSLRTATA
jgi:molybdate transport system regulatory protein